MGPAILTAVMTTIITFLPIFALEGSEGKLFTPLAWAKTLSMFGAVLVSLILVPALSVFFLKGNLKPAPSAKMRCTVWAALLHGADPVAGVACQLKKRILKEFQRKLKNTLKGILKGDLK